MTSLSDFISGRFFLIYRNIKPSAGCALEQILGQQDANDRNSGSIKWNFTKFLIDREGNIIARFEPTAPMSRIQDKVKEVL